MNEPTKLFYSDEEHYLEIGDDTINFVKMPKAHLARSVRTYVGIRAMAGMDYPEILKEISGKFGDDGLTYAVLICMGAQVEQCTRHNVIMRQLTGQPMPTIEEIETELAKQIARAEAEDDE